MGSKSIVNPAQQNQSLDSYTAESFVPSRASRRWQVLHTCDSIHEIADIIAGELAVGMRPSVITPEGFVLFADALRLKPDAVAQISLMNAWNDVRHWRKVILDADPQAEFDLLHAHSFSAGMAGVRNYPATVYEIDRFIEDCAASTAARATNPAEHSSWLSRSFRVAEQFVLSRAAAVVVRSESIRQATIRRGAAAENVFAVPAVVNEDEAQQSKPDTAWLQSIGIDPAQAVIVYAPGWKLQAALDGTFTEASRGLLEAFAIALAEEPSLLIFIECDGSNERAARELVEHLGIGSRLGLIQEAETQQAFDAASIIVADSYPSMSSTPQPSDTARLALLCGKTLLAADLPTNRDVTPSGRGCLWYRSGDYKDIAHRLSFLAHNVEFRTSLAASGKSHLLDSCNPAAIAMRYDNIYRHAAARRKSGGLQTPAIKLNPASAIV